MTAKQSPRYAGGFDRPRGLGGGGAGPVSATRMHGTSPRFRRNSIFFSRQRAEEQLPQEHVEFTRLGNFLWPTTT
jgi:hypothetical protein